MTVQRTFRPGKRFLAAAAAALLAMTAATAQVVAPSQASAPSGNAGLATTGIDGSGNYRQEVQACKSGKTQEDRDTCLREARNAQAAKSHGQLKNPNPDYQANAAARCEPLSGEDKAACQARVMGYGETSGSVAGGGVLRSVETVVLPPGQSEVTIEPRTSAPVVVVPAK